MNLCRAFFAAVVIVLSGCGNVEKTEAPAAPPPDSLPGVYSGIFPCDNCAGIDTAIWLREDGRFVIEQAYLVDDPDAGTATISTSLGYWNWRSDEQVLELAGSGPHKVFRRPDHDKLLLQTASDTPHLLSRSSAQFEFDSVMNMRGTIDKSGDSYSFTECLTGLTAPVATSGDYKRFWRQYRSVPRREAVAPVELNGRFVWAENDEPEMLVIERFITIRANDAC